MQVLFGAEEIDMPEISRKPREQWSGIKTRSIPALQSMDAEGVAHVVDPRALASLFWLQAAASKEHGQAPRGVLRAVGSSVLTLEESCLRRENKPVATAKV
jgi:hypothetical protein